MKTVDIIGLVMANQISNPQMGIRASVEKIVNECRAIGAVGDEKRYCPFCEEEDREEIKGNSCKKHYYSYVAREQAFEEWQRRRKANIKKRSDYL